LNPVKMQLLYRMQANRLALMKQYKVILTSSDHMRKEYIRNGIPLDRIVAVDYGIETLRPNTGDDTSFLTNRMLGRTERRLVFAGRMDSLKGGSLLLNLMPFLRSRLGRPVRLTLAGDGPGRRDWETVASRMRRSSPDLSIEFTGWLDKEQLASLFDTSDLFVMPSLWPEPFGIVGVEAGLQGLPSAAFRVGGIPTWLIDGVNGHLAPGDPPTANGLTDAIVKCLVNHDHYLDLRKGALAVARRFTVQNHMEDLMDILEEAAFGDTRERRRSARGYPAREAAQPHSNLEET
jgi:glycosyltransferase involved in cell wall biosynthesis